ncbi:MAG: hypothetical protein WC188_12870 [Candidatus Caldatribacteriota bacterium]
MSIRPFLFDNEKIFLYANKKRVIKNETLRLVPDEYRIDELEKDYKAMQEMLFGDIKSFKEIMDSLRNLEKKLNA